MGSAPHNLYRRFDGACTDPLWDQGAAIRATECEASSALLRDAVIALCERFEHRHRLAPGEGRFLLMDTGVRL